jgi:putative ABC transport system permease protein
MAILFKKLLRDLRENKGQFIAILVIVIIGVMFYTGINATFRNLSDASGKYYKEYRFADLWVYLYRAPQNILEKVDSIEHIKKSSGRIVQDVKINISGENAVIRVITLPDTREQVINDVMLKSGTYFSNADSNQCLVEEEFFKAHGLKLGDYITPAVGGNELKFKVIGSVKSPEYVYTLKDGSELMPDNLKFGIVYVKQSYGQAIFGYSGAVNNICVQLKDGANIEEVKDNIEKELEEFGVTDVIERKDQISNRMLSEEMKGLQSTGGAFPIVFFIVAAVIIYIMMGRMVENQRTQIGVLKAFGFSDMQVLVHYLSYSVFIGIAGSIIGSVFGMFLGKAFTQLENQYFNLPTADMKIYPELAIPASLLTLFFSLLAGFNSCRMIFRIMPSEAMRPKAPKAGKKILLERLERLWKKLSYSWKIILRNLFRYKRRAALTSVGIFFSSAILLVGFGMKDSVDYLIEQQYSNIQGYDIKVSFTGFLNMEELSSIRNIPHIAVLEPVLETGVEISNGWKKKNVAFTALISNPQLYKVTDKDGNAVVLPQKGVMIPEKISRALDVKQYDKVYVKPFLPGKDRKEMSVKGIVAQYIGTSLYGGLDNAAYLLGEGYIANGAVIKLDSPGYEREVENRLKEMPAVSSIQLKSDSLNNLVKNMGAMSASMGVFILLAGILSVAVVYNITTINIFERQRELATLKVLGFNDREVQKLVFYENFIITLFGMLLGLLFGKWLGNYMMTVFETDVYSFVFTAKTLTYIIAVILTIAFTLLANLTVIRKIRSIDMVKVLKSNE